MRWWSTLETSYFAYASRYHPNWRTLRSPAPLYDNEMRFDRLRGRMSFSRRTLLKAAGLGTLAGITGGCDAVGSVFGRMFAMPPRDTTYFTPNAKFYVVNYSDS